MGTLVQLLALALSRWMFYEVIYMPPLGIVTELAGNCRLFCISYFNQTWSCTHPHLLHVAQFPCSRNSRILPVPFVSCHCPRSPHQVDCSVSDKQLTRVCVRRLQQTCRSSKTKTVVAMVTVHQTWLHYLREIGVAAMIVHLIAISTFG